MPEVARKFDGRKYMWDGVEYKGKAEADEAASKYHQDKFDVQVLEEGGNYLVYTRRIAEAVVVQA